MTGPYIVSPTRPGDTPRNSIQLNVIVVVDVARALANGNLDGALMLVDNSVDQAGRPSAGRGRPAPRARHPVQCRHGDQLDRLSGRAVRRARAGCDRIDLLR
jgi:hypothetical protein